MDETNLIVDVVTKYPMVATFAFVVSGMKLVTMWFPSTADNKIMNGILKVMNWVALNVFKDKNKE